MTATTNPVEPLKSFSWMEWLDEIKFYIKLSTNVSNFKNKIEIPFEYKPCNVNKCLCTVQWLNHIKKSIWHSNIV